MGDLTRRTLSKGLRLAKRTANSNKHTKKVAQKMKKAVLLAMGTSGQRELYNLTTFYPTIQDYYNQTHDIDNKKSPLISILMPTYNTPELYLRECIESILIQSYSKWELCIADDNSSNKEVVRIIKEYMKKDPRVRLVERKENGHISLATNSALDIASGEYVALMDHDDVLWPNALYEIVQVIKTDASVDFVYSDEDKIDGSGKLHSYPFLKPDFSPEFLESCNYITHFSCIRTSVIKQVGGFRKGYEGAQDWDLFMRISEITQHITHIPKILYSWRIHEASTASNTDAKPYVYEAQLKLLNDHITRTNRPGTVETGIIVQHRTIKYDVAGIEKLSVFVRCHDLSATKRLLNSMHEHDAGMQIEIFIISTILVDEVTKADFKMSMSNLMYVTTATASELDVWLVSIREAKGEYLFFIEDEAETVSDNWARAAVSDCQALNVGLVGPVLLTPDRQTVLSAGIGIGYGETGFANMLQGMPFDDPHYSRGLYVKSRRNVSAFSPVAYAISKSALKVGLDVKAKPQDVIGLCAILMAKHYRHVYTPYLQIAYHASLPPVAHHTDLKVLEDPYLNPNFDHSNQRMEVRP